MRWCKNLLFRSQLSTAEHVGGHPNGIVHTVSFDSYLSLFFQESISWFEVVLVARRTRPRLDIPWFWAFISPAVSAMIWLLTAMDGEQKNLMDMFESPVWYTTISTMAMGHAAFLDVLFLFNIADVRFHVARVLIFRAHNHFPETAGTFLVTQCI